MELNAARKGKTLTITPVGELDHHSAGKLRNEIDTLLSDKGILELELDMKHVTFMDSSGLGVVLGRYRILSQRGGIINIRNAAPSVDRVFRMSGIYTLIRNQGK